jgi:hypothetical protein
VATTFGDVDVRAGLVLGQPASELPDLDPSLLDSASGAHP